MFMHIVICGDQDFGTETLGKKQVKRSLYELA
jgi:hypothetical protein